jgi:hypothetical protein
LPCSEGEGGDGDEGEDYDAVAVALGFAYAHEDRWIVEYTAEARGVGWVGEPSF